MAKLSYYKDAKTGRFISIKKARQYGKKIIGYSTDYKHKKIFTPPPVARLSFRSEGTGKFLPKEKVSLEKVRVEIYKGGNLRKKSSYYRFTPQELELIYKRFRNLAPSTKSKLKKINPLLNIFNSLPKKTNSPKVVNRLSKLFVQYRSKNINPMLQEKIISRLSDHLMNYKEKLSEKKINILYEISKKEITEDDTKTRIPF